MGLQNLLVDAKSWTVFDYEDGNQVDYSSGKPVRIYRALSMAQNDIALSVGSTVRLYDATSIAGTPVVEISTLDDYPGVWSGGMLGLRFDNGLTLEWHDENNGWTNGDLFLLVYEILPG